MRRLRGRGAATAGAPRGVARWFRVIAGAVALALLPVLAPMPASALSATDYPSWQDVIAAQANASSANNLIASLNASLGGLQDEVDRTNVDAKAKGQIYADAQQKYDEQNLKTQALIDQTTAAQADADKAYKVAAQVIAEMSKGGSGDLTPQLLTSPGSPDLLLSRLEISRVLGERYADMYQRALELKNRANALADQAEVAKALLEELRDATAKALQEATAAATAAADKLKQTQSDIVEVSARISYLQGLSASTTAAYNEGLKAQFGDGAEGEVNWDTGWARPVAGHITSNFGMRVNPVSHIYQLHTGVDLSGPGCGATIRAAHAGTVIYAGWDGSWGNYIATDNGDGTGNGYAHIVNGGIGVSIGQHVDPGQPIARVGSTGQSTGCHLHFIVRINGNRDLTDPVPFMRNQGITLN
ncbi:MAG: peptidoglycan DD-metalloendopeptidase family protein [Pseudolysinimonas sp.]|uniref:M23 family metallopeptidase n=1 Tax=Pseudolysinimonas sp. TaxID=2680009 RepID=UPI003266C35C